MKKILVTGASGYLAKALIPLAAEQASVTGISRHPDAIDNNARAIAVDIEDRAAVLDVVLAQKPDAVIHCAACNPGGSEQAMTAVNERGTKHVAEAVSALGCRLVSVSSDTVFCGSVAPYADNAQASPLPDNAYAVSKANGETIIRSIVPAAVIVRTSLIYDTNQIDRGTEGFVNRLGAGEPLQLFTDVIRQPIDRGSLSQGLCALALQHVNEFGFINLMGSEAISRYDFGVRMLDHWGVDYANQLKPVKGEGIAGLPLDLRVIMNRARQLVLPTPGLTEVLDQTKGNAS